MRTKTIAMTGLFGAALALAATAAVAQPGARPVRYGLNGPELGGRAARAGRPRAM